MIEQNSWYGGNYNLESFKGRAFELCLAVYRVTKLFPAGEIITSQLREASVKIVVFLAFGQIRDTILKVEELEIYLAVARAQNWLKPINFDLLKSAYSLLADALENGEKREAEPLQKREISTPPSFQEKMEAKPIISGAMAERQKIALDYLAKNQEVRVSELIKILGGVSERTVRNDLVDLIKRNLVRKTGSRKNAKYLLTA